MFRCFSEQLLLANRVAIFISVTLQPEHNMTTHNKMLPRSLSFCGLSCVTRSKVSNCYLHSPAHRPRFKKPRGVSNFYRVSPRRCVFRHPLTLNRRPTLMMRLVSEKGAGGGGRLCRQLLAVTKLVFCEQLRVSAKKKGFGTISGTRRSCPTPQ